MKVSQMFRRMCHEALVALLVGMLVVTLALRIFPAQSETSQSHATSAAFSLCLPSGEQPDLPPHHPDRACDHCVLCTLHVLGANPSMQVMAPIRILTQTTFWAAPVLAHARMRLAPFATGPPQKA